MAQETAMRTVFRCMEASRGQIGCMFLEGGGGVVAQFSPPGQKRLVVHDQLGRRTTLLQPRQRGVRDRLCNASAASRPANQAIAGVVKGQFPKH
jgi:hypothetical protein